LVDPIERRVREMLDQRCQESAIAARLHVCRCGGGEAGAFRSGKRTTFDVAFEFLAELLGECFLASARASINVASEVSATNPPRWMLLARRVEFDGHR
jgi:hypothetical protein